MYVDSVTLEYIRIKAKLIGMSLDILQGNYRRFFHDIAKIAGHGQFLRLTAGQRGLDVKNLMRVR